MRSLLLSLIVLSLACGDDTTAFDAGADSGSGSDVSVFDVGSDAESDDAGSDAGGDDGGPALDAGPSPRDVGPSFDAGPGPDAGSDAGTDAGRDAGRDAGTDAGPDAGSACHAYTFGQPAVDFRRVDTLPAMTGGVIPRGIYDAVDMQTTGMISGSYRGTWVFEDDVTLQTIDQLAALGPPRTAVPRTQTYRTAATSLQRARTCGGSDTFDNQYQVRFVGAAGVFLDVRQAGLMFTFERRD